MIVLINDIKGDFSLLELSLQSFTLILQLFQISPGMQVLIDLCLDSELVLLDGFVEFIDFDVLDVLDFVEFGITLLE